MAEETVIPLAEEVLRVARRRVEKGRVRVRVTTDAETRRAEEALQGRQVEVERIRLDRPVETVPPVRREGDLVVVPVVEEVLVVERRLILREEVHLRIVPTTRTETVELPVRVQRVVVDRLPPAPGNQQEPTSMSASTTPNPNAGRTGMRRTITALFDNYGDAELAAHALRNELGVPAERVRLHAQEATTQDRTEDRGFLASLSELFMPAEDRHTYSEGVRRGGTVLSAEVDDANTERAMDTLERFGAADLDAREEEWRRAGWAGYATETGGTTATTATAMPAADAAAARPVAREGEQHIPLAEEQLRIGKREVGHGRVRVRSYVVETPVEEQVTLRDEHVDIERRAVDRPATGGEELFQERTVEATETDEVPVVSKEARVREEVVVRKDADQRTETVSDTVRRTEVDVEDDRRAAGTGRPEDRPLDRGV